MCRWTWVAAASILLLASDVASADGLVVPPAGHSNTRDYAASVEEHAQQALIIFHAGSQPGAAREDLILRITAEGNVKDFAWIIPFPRQREIAREDGILFSSRLIRLSGG